jgi:sporulation protein YlmC with PRC-barrel domain
MNTKEKITRMTIVRLIPLAIAMAASAQLSHAEPNGGDAESASTRDRDRYKSENASSEMKRDRGNRASPSPDDAVDIRVKRASALVRADVIDRDGQKVGDIVDFAYDMQEPPRLHYVMVMTGGFLDMGGDVRAVPAEAISLEEETVRISVMKSDFEQLPEVPKDRLEFLTDSNNQKTISEQLNLAETKTRSARRDSDKRSGGRSELVLHSDLRNHPVIFREGRQAGEVADAWINVQDGRVPYIEIQASPSSGLASPFTNEIRNYAIPAGRFRASPEEFDYKFNVSVVDIREAESATETPGVERIQSGEYDEDAILLVTMPSASREGSTSDNRVASNERASERSGASMMGRTKIPDQVQIAEGDMSKSTVRHFAGMTVASTDGEKLGSVDDFIVDTKSGKVACAVVSSGGFAGVGDELRAVPVHAIQSSGERLTVEVTQADWKQTPTIIEKDYDDGRLMLSSSERDKLDEIYGSNGRSKSRQPGETPSYTRASKLRGMQVVHNGRDNELGEIESVVIDTSSGNAAVILDPHRDVVDSGKKVLVPLSKLQMDRADGDFVETEITPEELRRAAQGPVASLGSRD